MKKNKRNISAILFYKVIFYKKPWTLNGERGNQTDSWAKGKFGVLVEIVEKKEETENVPEGEIVQVLEQEREGVGWTSWRRPESSAIPLVSGSVRFLQK